MAPPSEEESHILYISSDDDDDQEEEFISNDEDHHHQDTDEDELNLNYDFSEVNSNSPSSNINYSILTNQDISIRQTDATSTVSTVLSVSSSDASLLLHRYNWNPNLVYENWFASEQTVRKSLGLLVSEPRNPPGIHESTTCGICFEDFCNSVSFLSARCGHLFCETCWKSYIHTSINDGPGCLSLRCPEISCSAAVGLDMIGLLASKDDRERFDQFMIRSYVENNRNCKWCPFPGCHLAVEFNNDGVGGEYEDVTCNCYHKFCWKCTEESHRPIGCDTLEKWERKNNVESNNTKWILAYTKPCPKCKRPIEKNQGCNRIACIQPCQFQFCWLCLQDWSVHGYTPCNSYNPKDESVTTQAMNRKHLEKYAHYYERWAANGKSKKKAVSDLSELEKNNLFEELSELMSEPRLMYDCVVEAWKQIVECRGILKWSYVYGYYLSEEDNGKTKLQLFEYLQGQAESVLERLHHCAEKEFDGELKKYIDGECTPKEFVDFRSKLKDLTRVTGEHFEKLVGGLKKGLSEVDSNADSRMRKIDSNHDHHKTKKLRRK